MNKFTIIFLLLFFTAAIIVGVFAIQKRLNLQGEAKQIKCPKQELPPPDFCQGGKTPKLTKNEKGCYIFICQ